MDNVKSYCYNDCEATLKMYNISIEKIRLRKQLSKLYDLNLMNKSDSSIGESIFIKYILEKKGIEYKELKASVKKPEDFNFYLGDIILPYIKFKSEEFNSVLDYFKGVSVTNGILKNVFTYNVTHKGLKYDYGAGGLHASQRGVFKEEGDYLLIDVDVNSYYPNISIKNKIFPEHLSEDFYIIYEEIYNTRKQAKKQSKLDPNDHKAVAINQGLKLSLNSIFGKSNSQYSTVYSPLFTASITINGQLMLSMLAENLSEICEVFYANTDGLTVRIHKDKVDQLYQICKDWEKLTDLELESVKYIEMYLRDVNNFAVKDEYGGIKYKGAYEIDKAVGKEPAVWKNNSSRIVPIAVSNYFFKNIPICKTLENHDNIYDFCKIGKAKRGWSIYYGDKKLSNINRYFLSNNKKLKTLTKVNNEDSRIISIEAHPNSKKGEHYHLDVMNKFVLDKYIDLLRKFLNSV